MKYVPRDLTLDDKAFNRFVSKFTMGDGCWEWNSTLTKGYGQFRLRGKYSYAHRISYALFVGAVPDGLVLDHECENRKCVRPSHLTPVTEQANILKGSAVSAEHAKKTHCPQGHEYSSNNTYVWQGRRQCRQCHLTHSRNHKEQQKHA